ncbi:MAG: chromate transporter [Bacteroidales bacterium]|nr:chromate transporter [Bacteroidales bacterium]
MIFAQLFWSFLVIGAFCFGGGYSMVAMIQAEVVGRRGWMTASEFTDLLAVSQMTPGPVGINTATYAGYSAVLGAGYPQWAAVCGSLLASLAVVAVPVALVLGVGGWLLTNKKRGGVAAVMRALRLAVVGLVAAAALGLMGSESFGVPGANRRFVSSVAIFAVVFLLSVWRKAGPLLLIAASGVAGLVVFSLP